MPNKISMIIHNLDCKCNMQCYECFNYNDLIKNTPIEYYSEDDVVNIITQQGYMFDCVVFSGGEFLLNNLQDIECFIKKIRIIFDGKIIIYTNGTMPHKVQYLLENNLADGFHVDMKLPYHLMDINEDKDLFMEIIGIKPTQQLLNDILETINIVVKHNNDCSCIRTVKYPMLTEDFFQEISNYIQYLNAKFNSNIKYNLNDFLPNI